MHFNDDLRHSVGIMHNIPVSAVSPSLHMHSLLLWLGRFSDDATGCAALPREEEKTTQLINQLSMA